MATAKVFQSGNSQAVRLPKELRFPPEVKEVAIRRQGDRLILE
ncbi:MAG TPA: type II toxin-antitoxin system VapB family antitoxin, partial [Thermoanaerobaculia bacterium]